MLHLFPHWNWRGHEGQVIPVMCYTNCDTVELLLNGKSFGTKGYEFPMLGMMEDYGQYPPRSRALRTTSDLHLSWDVPFEAGTLKAIGKRNGKVVATELIVTTGEPAAIKVSADHTSLAADSRDVAHLTIEITDADGHTIPIADNDVTLDITGPAKIIGMDSGNPADHDTFKSNHHKAFNGLCLAIVQTNQTAGQVQITARSPGLHPATIELHSQPPAILPTLP